MFRSLSAQGLVLAIALSLSACASDGGSKPHLASPAPSAPATRSPTRAAIDLLNEGRAEQARTILQGILAGDPQDATARKLIEQIDRDPKALLGAAAEPYRVRTGETMSMLAGRFLGDPLLFYALARYNGMAAPTLLQPSQVINIPRRAKPPPAAAPAKRANPPKVASAPAPASDPAAASQLRSAALDHLNRGGVDRAVALLRQAALLNPQDDLIKRDLQRALRLQATVKARS